MDAEPSAVTADVQRDGPARLVQDGVGDQVAGEQDPDVRVDGGRAGLQGGKDLAAGFGRRSRFGGRRTRHPGRSVGRVGAIVVMGFP